MNLPSGETRKFDIKLSNLKATSGYLKGNFSHFEGSSTAFCQRPSSTTQPQGLQWSLSVPENRMYILSWALNDHSLCWNVISFCNSLKGGWKRRRNPMLPLWKAFIVINLTTLFVVQYKERLISPGWHIPSRVLLLTMGAFTLTVVKIVSNPLQGTAFTLDTFGKF